MGLNFSVYKQCDKKRIFSDSPTMNARIPLLLCVWTFLSFQGKSLVRVGLEIGDQIFHVKLL